MPRVPSGKMPPEPEDKMSAPQVHGQGDSEGEMRLSDEQSKDSEVCILGPYSLLQRGRFL